MWNPDEQTWEEYIAYELALLKVQAQKMMSIAYAVRQGYQTCYRCWTSYNPDYGHTCREDFRVE